MTYHLLLTYLVSAHSLNIYRDEKLWINYLGMFSYKCNISSRSIEMNLLWYDIYHIIQDFIISCMNKKCLMLIRRILISVIYWYNFQFGRSRLKKMFVCCALWVLSHIDGSSVLDHWLWIHRPLILWVQILSEMFIYLKKISS